MPYSPCPTCTDSPFRTVWTNFLYSTVTWIQLAHHLNFQKNIAEIPNLTVCHYTVHVTMQAYTNRINKNSWYCLKTQSWRRLRLRPQRQECHLKQLHTMTLSDCFTWWCQCNAQQSSHNAQCMHEDAVATQYYCSFEYSTFISRKAVKGLLGKSWFCLSFWHSTSVSCEGVQIREGKS